MKIIMNFFYQSMYQLTRLIIPIITIPIVSKALGPTGIGAYNYVNSILQYFLLFASLGFNLYGNREIAVNKDSMSGRSLVFWEILKLQATFSILSMLLYFTFVLLFVNENQLLFFIQGIVILATVFEISWFFMGMEDFKKVSLINLLISIITFIFILFFIKNPSDLTLYVFIQSVNILASNICMIFFLKNRIQYKKVSLLDASRHIKPAIQFFIPKVSIILYTNLNKTVLGFITNKEIVGFYSNAVLLNTVIITLLTTLDVVLMPRMSSLFSKSKRNDVISIMRMTIHTQLFFSIAMFFGLISIQEKLVDWFFGDSFIELNQYIPLLSILIVIVPLGMSISRQYLIPNNQVNVYNKSVIIGAIVGVSINLLFIPLYGIYGAILSNICSETIVTYLRVRSFIKETGFRFLKKDIAFNIIVAILMCILIKMTTKNFPSSLITTLIQVSIGFVFYFSIHLIFKKIPIINKKRNDYCEN